MGAELVANILEIEKGRTPDWEAAESHLISKSDDELSDVAADLIVHRQDVSEDDAQGAACADERSSKARTALLNVLQSVIDCWHGASRNAIKYEATDTVILIVGGTTVGEPFHEIDDIEAFVASGMARAAGFIVGGGP